MKKKFQLDDLKVQSFVTSLEKENSKDLKGGIQDPSLHTGCTALSCGIVKCTHTLELNCYTSA